MGLEAVISNRPGAYGLERAVQANIEARCIDHTTYGDRESFDAALATEIDRHSPDLVVLAGFMRILSPAFVKRFEGRILNIHPSLLPKYPGLNTHQRAIDAGDAWHGVTVHFVSTELDGGPSIIQGRVPVLPDDDADSLAARVLKVEHCIYPAALRLIQAGRVAWQDGKAILDGEPLTRPIQFEPAGAASGPSSAAACGAAGSR